MNRNRVLEIMKAIGLQDGSCSHVIATISTMRIFVGKHNDASIFRIQGGVSGLSWRNASNKSENLFRC